METSTKPGTPSFKYPACWDDDVRMAALCALPRNESLNPYDWAGKYKFWKELILEWASHQKKMTLDYFELKEVFTRKGTYPASLERVLSEMNKEGDLLLENQVMNLSSNSSWTSWGIGLVKTSVSWSFTKVLSAIVEVEKEKPRFIVPVVLKEKAEEILRSPVACAGETLDFEELVEAHPEFFSNTEEAQLILHHLQKTGKVTIDASTPTPMIKFNTFEKAKPNLNSSVWKISSSFSPSPVKSKEKPAEITEVDRSLATLKRTEKLLVEEIDNLEMEMNSLEQTARTRLKEGSRASAKAALYRRKKLQIIHEKRNQALNNIQTMKMQLDQAKTDSKIMDAYKIGLSALKNSLSDLPLSEDKVQDTLIELEDALEQHRDIENLLSTTIATEDGTESDLEDELMNILAAAPPEEDELVWPTIPSESPKATASKKASQLPAN